MLLNRRFFLIAWPLVALSSAGVVQPTYFFLGIAGLALLGVATVVDYVTCTDPSTLIVMRRVPRRFAVGTSNPVELELGLRSGRSTWVTVRDEPPDEWEMRDLIFSDRVQSRHVRRWSYSVTPPQRGDYAFHRVNVSCRGSLLGLIERRHAFDLTTPIKVYPNYHEIRKFSLLSHRNKLNEMGLRPLARYGEGTEFESLREYTPDDEYRRIDWKASARHARLIARQHQIERSQHIMLVMDCGRLMGTVGDGLSRLDYAVNAALMLTHLALRQDDQVGLLVYDDRVRRHLSPRRHRSQLGHILEQLYALESQLVESNYAEAFEFYRKKQKRRSLAVIFTDVIDRRASQLLIRSVVSLYPRHLPLVVLLKDKSLESVVSRSSVELFDRFRKGAASEILLERYEAIGDLRSHGVLVLDVLPEQLTVSLLNRYIAIKSRGRL